MARSRKNHAMESAYAQALREHNVDDYGHATVERAFRAICRGEFSIGGRTMFIGQHPLIHRRNPTPAEKRMGITERQPLTLGSYEDTRAHGRGRKNEDKTQHDKARGNLYVVANNMRKGYSYAPPEPEPQQGQPEPQGQPQSTMDPPQGQSEPQSGTMEPEPVEPEPEPGTGDPSPVEPPQPEPQNGAGETLADKFREYDRIIRALRIASTARKLPSMDSMRLMIDGRKLIAAGLPIEGVVANVCSHMSDDTMLQLGVERFDWGQWGSTMAGEFDHGAAPAIHACIEANVPAWIWGGAGIGKSVGAERAADALGLPYYELNLSGQTASALTGRDRLKEFVQSNFTTAYRDGGVWNGEEIDNAHPQVLTLINNAIANGKFSNPVTGETIERHPDFRIVVTANTNGTGAAAGFIRNKIDRASLDRFACGMFRLTLDERLERNIIQAIERDLIAAAGE